MTDTRRRQLFILFTVFVCIFVADQITKALVREHVPHGGPMFEGRSEAFFYITHQRNTGLVGGMFRGIPWITYTAPLVATVVLIYLYRHLDVTSRIQTIAYGMVAAGAAGNLTDRLRMGYVTDFLQFHFVFIPFDFPWKHYPAFNVADAAICTGVFVLVLSWHRLQPTPNANSEANAPDPV